MSANSTREFARLGLLDQLDAVCTIPTELIYRDWRTGERIAAHPVAKDDWYVHRFGAPYYGIHRADLQKYLSGAFGSEHLHLGSRLVNIVEERDGVVAEFANGRVEKADLIVGAARRCRPKAVAAHRHMPDRRWRLLQHPNVFPWLRKSDGTLVAVPQ